MDWKQGKWLVLDVETTGLKPEEGARVWEIGWAEVRGLNVVGQGRWIVDPESYVPSVIKRLTGMDPSELEGKPNFAGVADELLRKMNTADCIVVYNVPFDRKFFEHEFRNIGKSMPDKPWLDPLVWAYRLLKTKDKKLVTVAQHFKVALENAHRAESDAVATAKVTIEFVKKPPVDDVLPDDLWMMLKNQEAWRAGREEWFRNRRNRNHPSSKIKVSR